MKRFRSHLSLLWFVLLSMALVLTKYNGYAHPVASSDTHYIEVFHNTDDIGVHNFTPNADLTFRIYDQVDVLVFQVTMPTFGNAHYIFSYYQHGINILPGFRVTVTDEVSEAIKEVLVDDIVATQFNPGESLIAGQAPAGAEVEGVVVNNNGDYPFTTSADPEGYWQIDISLLYPGLLIDEDSNLNVWVTDADGDRSEFQIFNASPNMEVLLPDVVLGFSVTPNEPANIEVYRDGSLIFGPWQVLAQEDGSIRFDLWKWGLHLDPGMIVTMHELVRDIRKSIEILYFTGTYDILTNTISGYAPANRTFPLEICRVDLPCYHVDVTSDDTGYWFYNLGEAVLPGWTGFLYDDDGDALNPDDGSPSPHPVIYADLHNNRIIPYNYAPDAQAYLRAYEPGSPYTAVISDTINMNSSGYLIIDTGLYGVDLLPDMTLEVEDVLYDGTTRPMTMTLDLISITDFITETNTLLGLANPLTDVLAQISDETGSWVEQWVTSAADGTWQATFDNSLAISAMSASVHGPNGHISGFDIFEGGLIQQVSDEGGTLIASDEQGDQTIITIPAGAVTATVSLAFTPLSDLPVPASFAFAGTAFDLLAYQNGLPVEGYTFQTPIQLTLYYSEEDVTNIDEDSLTLDYWDEQSLNWLDAATTCDPMSTYERHPSENYLQVSICHLSRFALFGDYDYRIFIPSIIRSP